MIFIAIERRINTDSLIGSGRFNILQVKLPLFSNATTETYFVGARKNRLIETVLLSTHNICFG